MPEENEENIENNQEGIEEEVLISLEGDMTQEEEAAIQNMFEKPVFESDDVDTEISTISREFKRGYKLYNFRRPDKFSKEHLRALQDIHRSFARNLSMALTAYLRMEVELDVISVDQLTYHEFTGSMPSSVQSGIFKLNPLVGEISLGLSPDVLTIILDRMLGGSGANADFKHELTSIEEALLRRVVEKFIIALEESWNSVLHVKSEFVSIDNGYHTVQIATPGEIVALLSFEIRIGQKNFGLFNICFPYPVLETVLSKLTPQYIFQQAGVLSSEVGRSEILGKINPAMFDLNVQLGTASISIDEVLDLKKGDIIKLDQQITEKLIVSINGKRKFSANPGVLENRLCIKIAEKYSKKNSG